MNTSRLRRLEATLPAGSNAGIALFCAAITLPTTIIALCLRVLS